MMKANRYAAGIGDLKHFITVEASGSEIARAKLKVLLSEPGRRVAAWYWRTDDSGVRKVEVPSIAALHGKKCHRDCAGS